MSRSLTQTLADLNVDEATGQRIIAKVQEYLREGHSAQEAKELALQELRDETKNELKSVWDQIPNLDKTKG